MVVLAVVALAAIGCGPTPRRTTPTDRVTGDAAPAWPMFRGRPDHAGDFGDRSTPSWKLRWAVDLGERIDASPVITGDGRVIVATREGSVRALATADGAIAARASVGAGVWSSPALAGDVLLLASADGHLHGLDAGTLRPRWKRSVAGASFSAITIAGGAAYVCAGSRLVAFDPTRGRILWLVELGAPSFTAPAVDADRDLVVVGTRAGDVLAFDRRGKPRWLARTTAGAHNDGSPVIAGELVLLGSNDRALHALAAADGSARWRVDGDHWVVSTPAVASDSIYVGDDGGTLRAIDLDGAELWSTRVGDDLASSPTVVGELVVHGAHDGKVHAHRRDGSGSLPAIDAGAPMYASPAVDTAGAVYIATHAGRVLAIE